MKICVLYTGGTIGSVGAPLSPMKGPDFIQAFQSIIEPIVTSQLPGCVLQYGYFDPTLDSTNMQPANWVQMAERVLQQYSSCDGFVLLHGTDTMAWTASALSYLLPGLTKPVIVTGAQLPLFYQQAPGSYLLNYNTDALRNVLGSITFATMGLTEVCVFFEDELLRGNRVIKSNSNQFIAFTSPNYPALGIFSPTPQLNESALLPLPPPAKTLDANLAAVTAQVTAIGARLSQFSAISFLLFPAYYDVDRGASVLASMLDGAMSMTAPPVKGLILESFGDGNVPDYPAMRALIDKLHSSGVVIIDCTQVYAGKVDNDVYATGAWLEAAGVVSSLDMIPPAALAKVIYLLGQGLSQAEVEAGMSRNLAGEMESVDRLIAPLNQFLLPGCTLISANDRYVLSNGTDGVLRLQDRSATPPKTVWSREFVRVGRLVMQQDCNLVYYGNNNQPLWATNTARIGSSAYFVVENDGTMKIYDYYTDQVIAVVS